MEDKQEVQVFAEEDKDIKQELHVSHKENSNEHQHLNQLQIRPFTLEIEPDAVQDIKMSGSEHDLPNFEECILK